MYEPDEIGSRVPEEARDTALHIHGNAGTGLAEAPAESTHPHIFLGPSHSLADGVPLAAERLHHC